jgi:hypothetical protein
MDDQERTDASGPDQMVAALRELIDALDRRVPHVERVGELRIAREAAALRKLALARIEELQRAASDRHTTETARAEAVMTDDGGPARKDVADTSNRNRR